MFEAVLAGVPVQEAVHKFMADRKEQAVSNIELF